MLEAELPSNDPIENFLAWLEEAREAGIPLAESVCLATATPDGVPSARLVLYKAMEAGTICFATSYRSRKALELEANPVAALVFYWQPLGRQLRVEGAIERASAELSDRIFLARPRASRISAWTSHQSAVLENRDALERRRAEIEREFQDREVTRPEFWGAYGLRPSRFEFWRHSDDRMHERVLFERRGNEWRRSCLQP